MSELDEATQKEIDSLCADGDELLDGDDFEGALQLYRLALALVPEPVTDWETGAWILTAMGDCFMELGDFEAARDVLSRAKAAPEGRDNPYIQLRLGEAQFELGNEASAVDELTRAYKNGSKEIFAAEDPKYWAFIQDKLKADG